jgi:hypothetical protein
MRFYLTIESLLAQHARPVLALDIFLHGGRPNIRVQLGNVSGFTRVTADTEVVGQFSPLLDI